MITFKNSPTRHLLSVVFILSLLGGAHAVAAEKNGFNNLDRIPDSVDVTTESGIIGLVHAAGNIWTNEPVRVTTTPRSGGLEIILSAPGIAVKSVRIRWRADLPANGLYLGDAWERAYGDLQWQPLNPQRIMPWYFLANHGGVTHGFGVKTDPSALCYWTIETNGISLQADVRCGGMGVQLGKRKLPVCTVVCRQGQTNETPFAAARALCRQMCPRPRIPGEPVYGFNDWYCTYGHDTAAMFLTNVEFIAELSKGNGNRPFAVVDDGWQWKGEDGQSPGLWNRVNPAFSSTMTMSEFAGAVRRLGARPGLWFRPLIANANQPQNWRLQRDPAILDPTVPQVRAFIRQTIKRFRGWGYEFIKHDYTTYDLCGRWGMNMDGSVTADGWAFADRSKTTAEVIRGLYEDIRSAAGNNIIILGCNTIGHLSAGLFEVQRVGDDTSGNHWARTRKMGVNSLAFRAPQEGTFFAIDADCVGQTSNDSVPWQKNSQWLYLLAHSGTPLFISIPSDILTPPQKRAMREALSAASRAQPLAQPLDWLERRTPEQWILDGREKTFSW
jgi:alpha-galactosidase